MSTQRTFDPSKANIESSAKAPKPESNKRQYDERVMMKVERYELTRDGSNDWAVGHSIVNPDERVRVRLSTIEERVSDNPEKFDEAKIRQQYEGEKRRETLLEKQKDKITLIAFDGARPLGVGEDGAKLYRAHWPQTMAAKAEAEVTHGLGNIVLYQPPEGATGKSEAYVEFLRAATIVDASNVKEALVSALATVDDNGHARDPHAIMRVFHNGQEVAEARVFPARVLETRVDPTFGDEKEVPVPLNGERTFEALLEAKATGIDSLDTYNDLARTVVAGLMDADEPPKVNKMNPDIAANYLYGAKNGELTVEIIKAERMAFGKDSAKTYLKDSGNLKFRAYQIRTEKEGERAQWHRGYAETVVATHRHENGQPYVVYASPVENFPRAEMLSEFDDTYPLSRVLPEDEKAPRRDASSDYDQGM